jgi:hypothetical protein
MTLKDAVCAWRDYDRRKHGLSWTVEEKINELTPYELLCEISEALEEVEKDRGDV